MMRKIILIMIPGNSDYTANCQFPRILLDSIIPVNDSRMVHYLSVIKCRVK